MKNFFITLAIFLVLAFLADKIWDMVRRRKHRKENLVYLRGIWMPTPMGKLYYKNIKHYTFNQIKTKIESMFTEVNGEHFVTNEAILDFANFLGMSIPEDRFTSLTFDQLKLTFEDVFTIRRRVLNDMDYFPGL
jgi:hypothetical protein